MNLHKIFAVCFGILLTFPLHATAQGRFLFNNSSSTKITTYDFDGTIHDATNLTVAVYFSTDTNAVNHNLPMTLLAVTNIIPALPGRFGGGTTIVPGTAAGDFIAVEIRAWSASYPTWDAAFKAWNCHEALLGSSRRFVVGPLTVAPFTPASLLGPGKFDGLGASVNTAITICEAPTLSIVSGVTPFRLRIDGHPNDRYLRFQIQTTPTLVTQAMTFPPNPTNGWQVLTNLFPTNFPTFWSDPQGTNSPRYYRVWVSVD
jgi:hypothetical protein